MRTTQPQTYPIHELKLLPAIVYKLKNNIVFTGLNDPNLTLIRLDIRLKAGSYYQQKKLSSHAAIKLMTEGIKSMSSEQIAEELDYAGAYFEIAPDCEFATFSIYFPKKSAEKVMPIVAKLFVEAVFPEDKIAVLKNNLAKNLAINMEKTSYLAHSHFIANIFGKQHPYGTSLDKENIDSLQREDVVDFYQRNFHAGNIRLFAAGDIDDDFLTLLDSTIGDIPYHQPNEQNIIPINPSEEKVLVEKENAVQSSICIGRRLFNIRHEDWIEMSVVNTVLGGYFGSRLMTNIREEKGLTYGIYSRMTSLQLDGTFMIRADVNRELVQRAIEEIYKELEQLQQQPIKLEELDLVKNYLYGSILRSFDGVFSQIDRFVMMSDYRFTSDYWGRYLERIREMDARKVQELAEVYLQVGDMVEIVVG